MAAAAAAAAPVTPLQQWQDFNVELWMAEQPRVTLHGQGGIRKGARNAWAALVPGEEVIVIGEVNNWRNARTRLDATLANPSPLPNAVPNTTVTPRLRDFFERGYNVISYKRRIASHLNTIVTVVQHKTVRNRVLPFRDQAQTDAATWMAAIGAMEDYTRRLRDLGSNRRIGPNGPTILLTPPTATYGEDRDYLDGHLDALIERRNALQALLDDINTELQRRNGNANVVPRGERLYLLWHKGDLQRRINLLTHIVEILRRWKRDVNADGGAPTNQFGREPSLDELEDFIEHIDGIKDFENANGRMINCYRSRFVNPPNVAGTEVETLFPSIDRCHQQHINWFNRANDEVDRLHGLFETHWGDWDALDGDQQESLRLHGEKALRQREARNADLSGSWMGPMFLGAGSHGKASIWIKQDAAGRISDRVTVKDTNNVNPNYTNATGVVQPPPGMPMEAVAMLKLVDLKDSSSVVNIRNWRRKQPYDDYDGYRIYMEFCSGGDLRQLFRNHWPRNPTGGFMPEPFMWAIFDSLVSAGLLMQGKHLRDAAQMLWDEIVHGDMKSDNVFLGENTSSTFRGFPQAKLGDFGLATIFPKVGLQPVNNWLAWSGPGYRAPEMAKIYGAGNVNLPGAYAPESPANVWGVGFIMRSLIHRNPWANLWQGDGSVPGEHPTQAHKPSDFQVPQELANYSPALLNLIMSCLEVWPQNRPTFEQLRESILAEVGPDGTDPSRARLRDADPATDARLSTGGPPPSRDEYAIGLAINELSKDALPAARFRDPPAVNSPVRITVGGRPGEMATRAEIQDNAGPALIQSVLSRKRTFDKIS